MRSFQDLETVVVPATGEELLHSFHLVSPAEGPPFWVAVPSERRDEICHAVAAGTFSLPVHCRALLAPLAAGATVMDLGAHIGTFTLAAAARGLRVIAVEASPRNAELLRASVRRNGFGDLVSVENAAVGATRGSANFLDAGAYGYVLPAGAPLDTMTTVITVDDLVDPSVRVAAIKMDIEGSEPAAIAGARRTLSGEDAPPITYECNGHTLALLGSTPGELHAALWALGYQLFVLRAGGLSPLAEPFMLWDCVSDCVAVREKGPEILGLPILPALTRAERIREMVAFAAHPSGDYRLHVARTLAGAAQDWLALPEARQVATDLCADAEIGLLAQGILSRRNRTATPSREQPH